MKIGEHEVVVIDKDAVKVGCQVVSREDIKRVLDLMRVWTPPKPQFKVGDYVRVRKAVVGRNDFYSPSVMDFAGMYGKVVKLGIGHKNHEAVGVEFVQPHILGHSLDGAIPDKHGHYFAPEMLERVD